MEKLDYLLQEEIPGNEWLFKDHQQDVIRNVSAKVKDPEHLTKDEEILIKKLIDYVTASQDEVFNDIEKDDHMRPAVGIAAPQIGVNLDMFYVRFHNADEEIEEYAMINTELISSSARIAYLEKGEGCLSVDVDHPGIVPRAWKIVVKGYNWLTQAYVELTLRDYQAIVFQHEMEHNVGKLYYDRINQTDPEFVHEDWVML